LEAYWGSNGAPIHIHDVALQSGGDISSIDLNSSIARSATKSAKSRHRMDMIHNTIIDLAQSASMVATSSFSTIEIVVQW
jgi:hypothetical protein